MGFLESFPRPTKTYRTTTYDRIAKQHNFDGTGKTILITGGASGIGYTFSQAFARAGVARIAIVSRSPGPQEKAKAELAALFPSTEILTFQASVTDHARMIEILQELDTVDVLILNAAIAHRRTQASEVSLEEIQDAFNINTIPVFNLTKAYLAMPPPKSGCKTIINISSAATHMPGSFRVGYGPSKAAAALIMQNFSSQFRGDDVKIFSLHPGSIYTPGTAQWFPKEAVDWDDVELPADFTVWLAGSESGFLHGRHLWANWDVDELMALKEKITNEPMFLTIGLIQ